MHVTLTLVVALALAQPTSGGRFERTNSRTPQGRSDRGLQAKTGGAWFEFAPASGKGLPFAQSLCSQLTASEKTGNWWCRDGNGMATGSAVAVNTVQGSAAPSSQVVCPNGPSCGAVASMYMPSQDSNHAYTEAANVNRNVALTTGGFTHCWLGQVELGRYDPSERFLSSLSAGGTPAGTFIGRDALIVGSSDLRFNAYISTSGTCGSSAFLTISSTMTAVSGAPNLFCLTWSASDGIYRTYVNGTAGGTSVSSFTSICGGGSTSRYTISGFWNGSAISKSTQGHHFGVFDLPQQLSASRIAEIAHAVLADAPTGAKGEPITVTRNSVQGCIPNSAGSIAPPNRLCVHSGGTTASQGSFTQYALRTEEFDNAAWTKGVAVGTITANYAVSPVGTMTAERYQYSNTTGDYILQSFVVPGTPSNISVYLKGTNNSGTIYLCRGGTVGQCVTCSYSASAWSRCQYPGTFATSYNAFLGCDVPTLGGACAQTGMDVLIWGANFTTGTSLRPYIPATSAAVTTASESVYATLPANAPALASVEATFDAPASWTASSYIMSVWKDASNRLDAFVDTAAGNKLSCTFVVGGTSYTGLSTSGVSTSATHRVSCSYAGGNVVACVDGTCNSTAQSFTLFSGATRVYLGNSSSGASQLSPMPILKGVKADPNPSKFR
jgi:hypothetical protein